MKKCINLQVKQCLSLVTAAVLSVSLGACASSSTASTTAAATTVATTKATASETTAPETTATEAATSDTTRAETETAATEGEKTELVVFAAASMTETLTELKELYEAEHSNVTITYNFDSSGTLKTQIQEGADCDLFISASQKQMNQLDITADSSVNTEGLDFVDESTRINLLENQVTLVVPADNPKGIDSFDTLAEKLSAGDVLLAMGNSDVPVGQYTQKILAFYNLDEETLAGEGLITYGSNVKEVTTQVAEGSVDCGVIYCTDAYSAGLTIVDYATKDMCGQVIYPAAVLKNSAHAQAAQAFLTYLTTDEAMTVFEKVGFIKAS
ncbi:molybdate ABC transporter substrate-binding protein [Oscillospiraceae bacterium HV4-5-C5C]|nr:molybdate ABC transporter substrate-binding protein [Oscillospiraceae bacterium HV4-5-C5C]